MRALFTMILAIIGALAVAQFLLRGVDSNVASAGIAARPASGNGGNVIAGEAYAIDGDTIRIDRKTKIRLSGVAAPERHERGGSEATDFMKRLINGQTVRCELNGERTYDRLVGTCYRNGLDIGKAIIAAGLARDCPRYSGGRYAAFERPEAKSLTFPRYCLQR